MDLAAMLKEYSAAVEAADAVRVAALFTSDSVYHDTLYGELRGPEAIRALLETRFTRDAERFLFDFFDPVANGTVGYALWALSYRSKMPQVAGKRVVFNGVSHFELAGGKIKQYREHLSIGIVLVQLGFDADRIENAMLKQVNRLRGEARLARHFAG